MPVPYTLDRAVHDRLQKWPQTPPGYAKRFRAPDAWFRARPGHVGTNNYPFLKYAGSSALRTMPDGLWLNFGGTPADPYVDIVVIEACGSLTNLLDKRSRFAPSTQAMMAVCPVRWLCAPALPPEPMPRWRTTGVIDAEPVNPFVLPVRDMRIFYGLKRRHYRGFALNIVPHAHEYFMPMDALTAEDGDKDPALLALLARASGTANFMTSPC